MIDVAERRRLSRLALPVPQARKNRPDPYLVKLIIMLIADEQTNPDHPPVGSCGLSVAALAAETASSESAVKRALVYLRPFGGFSERSRRGQPTRRSVDLPALLTALETAAKDTPDSWRVVRRRPGSSATQVANDPGRQRAGTWSADGPGPGPSADRLKDKGHMRVSRAPAREASADDADDGTAQGAAVLRFRPATEAAAVASAEAAIRRLSVTIARWLSERSGNTYKPSHAEIGKTAGRAWRDSGHDEERANELLEQWFRGLDEAIKLGNFSAGHCPGTLWSFASTGAKVRRKRPPKKANAVPYGGGEGLPQPDDLGVG